MDQIQLYRNIQQDLQAVVTLRDIQQQNRRNQQHQQALEAQQHSIASLRSTISSTRSTASTLGLTNDDWDAAFDDYKKDFRVSKKKKGKDLDVEEVDSLPVDEETIKKHFRKDLGDDDEGGGGHTGIAQVI